MAINLGKKSVLYKKITLTKLDQNCCEAAADVLRKTRCRSLKASGGERRRPAGKSWVPRGGRGSHRSGSACGSATAGPPGFVHATETPCFGVLICETGTSVPTLRAVSEDLGERILVKQRVLSLISQFSKYHFSLSS